MAFSLGSARVELHPTFPLIAIAGVGLWHNAATLALWLLACFVSILVHELGHALVFRAYRGRDVVIRLSWTGGLTTAQGDFSSPQIVAIAVAGPLVGFLCAGIVYLVAGTWHGPSFQSQAGAWFTFYLLWTGVGWGVFNLLPIPPLDGGLVLLHSVKAITGRGEEAVTAVAILLCAIMGLVGLRLGPGLLAYCVLLGSYNAARLREYNVVSLAARQARAAARASAMADVPNPRRNRLAGTSLVFSLVFFVPFTSLVGVVLGLSSIVQLSRGRLETGKGLAIAGVAIGTFMLLAHTLWLMNLLSGFHPP
jgi:Zn-dependent protease